MILKYRVSIKVRFLDGSGSFLLHKINQNCHAEFISASYQHKIETPRLLDPETVLDYSGSHGSNVPLELTG